MLSSKDSQPVAQAKRRSTPPPTKTLGNTTKTGILLGSRRSPTPDLELVMSQVVAAESEAEAAKARAEAARAQIEATRGHLAIAGEELEATRAQTQAAEAQSRSADAQSRSAATQTEAAKAQTDAARSQTQAATAQSSAAAAQANASKAQTDAALVQKDAAKVQAEAAIAQAEAAQEQGSSIAKQTTVLRLQTETLVEQSETAKQALTSMIEQGHRASEQVQLLQKQSRALNLIGVSMLLSSLALIALAGVGGYWIVTSQNQPTNQPLQSEQLTAAISQALAIAQDRSSRDSGDEEATAATAAAARLESSERAVRSLGSQLDLIASRVADEAAGDSTDRIALTYPALEARRTRGGWSSQGMRDWLTKARQTSEDDSARSSYLIKGSVRRLPIRDESRIVVDLFDGQWRPAGPPIDINNNGTFAGTIRMDEEELPSKMRVTLRSHGRTLTREYTMGRVPARQQDS